MCRKLMILLGKVGLTVGLLYGTMGLHAQQLCLDKPCETIELQWIAPAEVTHEQLCHKEFLRFWRVRMQGEQGQGDWHLYNKEDDRYIKSVASNTYSRARIEWTAMEGKLPK